MNAKQIGLLVATAAVGGGLTYGILGDNGEVRPVVYEYQAVPKAYVATNGKVVRLVGENPEHAIKAVVNSEVGRAAFLPVDTAPGPSTLCNVVFIAKEHPFKAYNGLPKPDAPQLEIYWKDLFTPRYVADADEKNKIWWGVLQGYGCVEVAKLGADYLGSSVEQLRALPIEIQKKFMRTTARPKEEGSPPEAVPVGDDTADPEAEVYFPHEVFGRPDLNFEKEKQGKVEKNYTVPEDGFDALPEEASP